MSARAEAIHPSPLPDDVLSKLRQLSEALAPGQLQWASGYLYGRA